MLPDGFVCAVYQLPKDVFVNGCVEIEIFEEHAGVMISELRIVKKNKDMHCGKPQCIFLQPRRIELAEQICYYTYV